MNRVIFSDAIDGLKNVDSNSCDCCVTSPPYYGLRDYGADGQIGLEKTPFEYIQRLVDVFHEVKRVLKEDGTLWIVIGDSYAGSGKGAANYPDNAKKYKQGTNKGTVGFAKTADIAKKFDGIKPKDLIGIPWMLAFALREDGWYLRQDIIWEKPNPMPESVKDRCTKSHEYVFLFSKSKRYYFDSESISEPVCDSSMSRYKQNIENQKGSERAYGKKNGKMKAVLPRYGGNKYTKEPDKFYRTKSGNAYEYRPRRNKRDVWNVPAKPYKGSHFATYPDKLITPCILAGSRIGGTVIDPFCGSGTTLMVAGDNGRDGIGIELNSDYQWLIQDRIGFYEKIGGSK